MNRVAWYVGTIAIGLWVSATGMGGWLPDGIAEWPVNVWCWGLFAFIYATTDRKERIEMVAVVALATPMELFFSEVWLVYEYQRDFMPLFVPAGHYFLFDLGRHAANKLREQWVMPLLLPLSLSSSTGLGREATRPVCSCSCWFLDLPCGT